MKATSKAVTTPIIIIQPNVIIGKIPLTTRDPNATRVVNAVYKQGRYMLRTACLSSLS